jgi:hypothetical protein
MSNQRKKIQKKKTRQKAVKKKIVEKRLQNRREIKFMKIRDEAFEKEFAKKQALGLSDVEIKERLENNLKILEALEEEYMLQNPEQNKEVSEEIKQQLEIQQKVIQENSLEKQNNS